VVLACKEEGVIKPPFISCRVTQVHHTSSPRFFENPSMRLCSACFCSHFAQVYDTGACVYFYLGFMWTGLADPVAAFTQVQKTPPSPLNPFTIPPSSPHPPKPLSFQVEDRARLKILECGGRSLSAASRPISPRRF
jgi:hypothetical protein